MALTAVQITTIQKWEYQMIRWIEAYWSGLGAKEAQFQVKTFSSKHYKSHRHVSETLACQFDS